MKPSWIASDYHAGAPSTYDLAYALRTSPGCTLDFKTVIHYNYERYQAALDPLASDHLQARQSIYDLFSQLQELGLGVLQGMVSEDFCFHKKTLSSLSLAAQEWLKANGVPAISFGALYLRVDEIAPLENLSEKRAASQVRQSAHTQAGDVRPTKSISFKSLGQQEANKSPTPSATPLQRQKIKRSHSAKHRERSCSFWSRRAGTPLAFPPKVWHALKENMSASGKRAMSRVHLENMLQDLSYGEKLSRQQKRALQGLLWRNIPSGGDMNNTARR